MKHFKLIPIFLTLLFAMGCSNDEPVIDGKPAGEEQEGNRPGNENTDDEIDMDLYPVSINIKVEDSDGNNLFSDDYHGSLDKDNLLSTITYLYKGETAKIAEFNSAGLHQIPYEAEWRGLYVDMNPKYSMPPIRFGDIESWSNYDETIAINWPDGSTSKIDFELKSTVYDIAFKIRVDGGEWANSTSIVIVK